MTEAKPTSTAADFLATKGKRRYADCKAAERIGLTARMQSLSQREKQEYEAKALDPTGNALSLDHLKRQRCRLIVLCLVDENNHPIFTTDHIDELNELDAGFIEPAFDEIARHVGYAAGEIDALVKNADSIGTGVTA